MVVQKKGNNYLAQGFNIRVIVVLIIQQTWWHIEELYCPSKARKIRQVMDIFTDQNEIPLTLHDLEFVGLRITGRNANSREIPFIEKNTSDGFEIILNLDPIDSYPKALSIGNHSADMLRHVKLEIEYINIKPKIEELHIDLLKDWFLPKKTSTISMAGRIQPEFYLTLPLGWIVKGTNIFNEGLAVALREKIHYKANTGKIVGKTRISTADITVNEPFINLDQGKRKYNYLVAATHILNFYDSSDKIEQNYEFTYISQMSLIAAGIALIPFGFGLLSLYMIYCACTNCSALNTGLGTGLLIALLSFSFFYANLLKEGYDLPHRRYFLPMFILTVGAIALIFYLSMAEPVSSVF